MYIKKWIFLELREDTVQTLLSTSCLLQIDAVTDACCTFLAQQLHPSNCLGISLFAEHQSCTKLFIHATQYTYEHFMQVISCFNSKSYYHDSLHQIK